MKSYTVIGLMSGTSLDGVDLAFCRFHYDTQWRYELVAANTFPYAQKWKDILSNAQELSEQHLQDIDAELGGYYAQLIENFINEFQLVPDFISSHGHTAIHKPDLGRTLQLGSGEVMCEQLRIPVVNDFRKNDVLLGGQGAPLVPIGDKFLFGEAASCLNLGGFSNISFDLDGQRVAFDICPVNMALNEVARITGKEYDRDGKMAEQGSVHTRLLSQLNTLAFYKKKGPRSLGREWYTKVFQPLFTSKHISPIDLMATLVEHMAMQISAVLEEQSLKHVLITGGGAYNSALIERLSQHCSADIEIPDSMLVEYKEALVFAFLGVLRLRNEINTLASVTGASKDHCSGVIHKP